MNLPPINTVGQGPSERNTMFTVAFWKATAERVIRGGAVAAGALLALDHSHVDWGTVGQGYLYGAVGSLLLCLAGGAIGAGNGPSLTGNETAD